MTPFVIRPHLSESTFAFPIALNGVVVSDETPSVSGEIYWRWDDEPDMKWQLLGAAVAGHSLRVPFDLQGRNPRFALVSRTSDGKKSVSRIEEAEQAVFSAPAKLFSGEMVVEAGEDLTPFDLVHIYDDGGVTKARKADASDATKPARAFVVEAASGGGSLVGGQMVRLFFGGNLITSSGAGWTSGDVLYLSETAGGITTTAPTDVGTIIQVVGTAITDEVAIFEPDEPALIL